MRFSNTLRTIGIVAISGLTIPAASAPSPLTMNASWYGLRFQGLPMANGLPFDMHDPSTAAHKDLPLGTKLVATNLNTGKTCRFVVRDRGPFIPGRSLDVSYAGAQCLGFVVKGVETLRVLIVP